MNKILAALLIICCSTVAYASSVSVLMTMPQNVTAWSIAATATDVSTILTAVYGEYGQTDGKNAVGYATSALSVLSQQGVTYSYPANAVIEREAFQVGDGGGDSPTPNPSSPTPVPEPNALLLVGIGLAGLGITLRLRP